MLLLVLTRIAHTVPMLVLVTLVSFGLMVFSPVDPARMALTAGATGVIPDEREVAAKRAELGLDRPLWERYGRWWLDLFQLDLGASFSTGRPVTESLLQRLPASLALALLALVLAVVPGIILGLVVAVRAETWLDNTIRLWTTLAASLPNFWLAFLCIWLFAVKLNWVPALGSFSPVGILLPAIVLALRPMARIIRLMRATTLDVLNLDYVTVARSKGLSEPGILFSHVLPNAIVSVLAVIGLDFTSLMVNAAVIEWVFAWPGIGRLGVEAAFNSDLPVLMGFVVLSGWVVVLVNLSVDIAYSLVDPRPRREGSSA